MYEVSVLIRSALDVPGQWTAHCLNWDIVTQGDSPTHAMQMACDAIAAAVGDDVAAGLDPAGRKPAPPDLWDLFQKIRWGGVRIAPADADRALEGKPAGAIAATMYVQVEKTVHDPWAPQASVPAETPQPFMIAALGNNNAACG